jgi:epoxyqueuosine reductase
MGKKQKNTLLTPPFDAKKVLLHSCCAPCACSIMETMKKNKIECTVFFYNPNIDTLNEYNIRKEENIRFAEKLNMKFIDGDYINDKDKWLDYIAGYENAPERGNRCTLCFEMRLKVTAEYAVNNNFKIFTSSLGISRWKDFEQVSKCGDDVAEKFIDLTYWKHNWRKQGGSKRMSELTKLEGFYRQQYCGCIFSKKQSDC